jgi:FKBP-type peptidyl-prolyl cis-trans isomerase
MRIVRSLAAATAITVTAGCQAGDSAGSAALDTDDQKASYAIGVQVGSNLKPTGDHFDEAAFVRGMRDALADAELALPEDTLRAVSRRLQDIVQEEQAQEREMAAERNKAEGEAYLAENGARDGVVSTESGLQYEVIRMAEGPTPGPTDQVTIHYKGTLIDGTQFDSSYDRDEPATFGVNGVIPGFSEGLQLMEVGSQYRFVIPGALGYGEAGAGGDIGPNATLIFEVELLEIP